MQYAVIIDHDRRTGTQLHPVLGVGALQQPIPRPDRLVPMKEKTQHQSHGHRIIPSTPFFNDLGIQTVHHAPIVVIPPHLVQLPRRGIVIQNRVPGFRRSLVNRRFVSSRVCWNRDGGEEGV